MTDKRRASELTLADLLVALWRGRYFVLAGAALGLVCALAFFATAVPRYKAVMLVGPESGLAAPRTLEVATPDGAPSLSSSVSEEESRFVRFESVLRGATVAAALSTDKEIFDKFQKDPLWPRGEKADTPEEKAALLSRYLQERVAIQPVGETALRRLVYTHPDRAFAVRALRALSEAADDAIRRDDNRKLTAQEGWLIAALDRITHPDHRKALTVLLMRQEQKRMLLAVDAPFAAAVIEPASSDVRAAWPRKRLLFPAFILAGAFLGYVVFGVRCAFRGEGAVCAAGDHPPQTEG